MESVSPLGPMFLRHTSLEFNSDQPPSEAQAAQGLAHRRPVSDTTLKFRHEASKKAFSNAHKSDSRRCVRYTVPYMIYIYQGGHG